MHTFFQIIAGVLIAVILGLSLSKQGKDITLLLGIAVCCMVLSSAIVYLRPVMEFIHRLQDIGEFDSDAMGIILKAVGIGLVSELSALICTDSGNAAMAKTIQILAGSVVLWLSLPLMNTMIDLIQKILGEL